MDKYLCEATDETVIGWLACGFPATEIWRYACVHEHVKEGWTCRAHRPAGVEVGCLLCMKAGHDCTFEVKFVTAIETDKSGAQYIVIEPK